MRRFHVTYDIVTPESAEQGAVAEGGFMLANATRMPIGPADYGEKAGQIAEKCGLTLHEAVDLLGLLEDTGDSYSYYEADPRQDYRTGNEETRSLHLPYTVTAASAARVAKVLKARRLL